jgi:hypothetical protein
MEAFWRRSTGGHGRSDNPGGTIGASAGYFYSVPETSPLAPIANKQALCATAANPLAQLARRFVAFEEPGCMPSANMRLAE